MYWNNLKAALSAIRAINMGEETNLLELITKDNSFLQGYLSDVTIEEFKVDVKNLAKKNIARDIVEDAVEKLKQLL